MFSCHSLVIHWLFTEQNWVALPWKIHNDTTQSHSRRSYYVIITYAQSRSYLLSYKELSHLKNGMYLKNKWEKNNKSMKINNKKDYYRLSWQLLQIALTDTHTQNTHTHTQEVFTRLYWVRVEQKDEMMLNTKIGRYR